MSTTLQEALEVIRLSMEAAKTMPKDTQEERDAIIEKAKEIIAPFAAKIAEQQSNPD